MGKHLVGFVLGLLLLTSPACQGQFSELTGSSPQSEEAFAAQRRKLVEVLKSQGVKSSAVLDALRKVPRHKFVPASQRHRAYENRALPLAHDQTISQPYIVGYMTEAARCVVAFGFGQLGLVRIQATCYPRNPASAKVMQKIGMTYEGLLRGYVYKDGIQEDIAMYAMLRSDWDGVG